MKIISIAVVLAVAFAGHSAAQPAPDNAAASVHEELQRIVKNLPKQVGARHRDIANDFKPSYFKSKGIYWRVKSLTAVGEAAIQYKEARHDLKELEQEIGRTRQALAVQEHLISDAAKLGVSVDESERDRTLKILKDRTLRAASQSDRIAAFEAILVAWKGAERDRGGELKLTVKKDVDYQVIEIVLPNI